MTARTCAQCGQPCSRQATRCKRCANAAHGITSETGAQMVARREEKRARLAALAERAIAAGLDKEDASQ